MEDRRKRKEESILYSDFETFPSIFWHLSFAKSLSKEIMPALKQGISFFGLDPSVSDLADKISFAPDLIFKEGDERAYNE